MPGEWLQLFGFFLVFIVLALAMFFRRIPALLALPLMAILIALLGGVGWSDLLESVIADGAIKLHRAYTVAMFGGMLSFLLQKSSVAESLIKKGAELAGDKPWSVALIMLLVIAMLFTTLGGLGAIIMVATIALPILSSVGISATTTAGIFLVGLNLGGILNAGNWALYVDVLQLERSQIQTFALILFAVILLMCLVYLTRELMREGHPLSLRRIIAASVGVLLLLTMFVLLKFFIQIPVLDRFFSFIGSGIKIVFTLGWIAVLVVVLVDFLKKITGRDRHMSRVKWTAYLTPLIPLILILVFKLSFITAFVLGLLYGFVVTYRKGSVNMLSQAIIEGGGSVIPAVALMMGIGMLLNAIMGPGESWSIAHQGAEWPVLALLRPVVEHIVPSTPIAYVLVFTILAPLALYRGPLNVWGMGYGLAAVIWASGSLPPAAIMGMLLSVGVIQGVSDPTNTHNVWIANELHLDVQQLLWKTLPYVWVTACVGLICSALLHF
ncbi:citrate transporter [candidate division KSB1 bacterium]|nr:citrate transporter [candidate division KSB1 bacterium]